MPNRKIKKSLYLLLWRSDLNIILLGFGYVFLITFLGLKAHRTVVNYPMGIENFTKWEDILCYVHFPLMYLATLNFFTLENRTPYDDSLTGRCIRYRNRAKAKIMLMINSCICIFIIAMKIIFLLNVSVFSYTFLITSIFHSLYVWGGIGVFAIELGMAIAQIKNKSLKVLLFIVSNFIIGYPMLWINDVILMWWDVSFYESKIKYLFMEIFNLLPDGLNGSTDGYGCHAIEVHKYFLLIAWITTIHLINMYRYQSKQKWKFAMYSTIGILCCFCVAMPYGKIDGTGQRTYNKYRIKDEAVLQLENMPKEDEVPFTVSAYTMDFYILHNLYAKVQIDVEEAELDTYCFTLLKGYKVISVKNQNGKKMKYEQVEDYLYIDSSAESIQSFQITYCGANDPLYSDLNGIYLPAGVPFYPMPGEKNIYKQKENSSSPIYVENHLDNVTYNVQVHTLLDVYSSLDNVERNHFKGVSDGFFLLAGNVFSNTVDETTFYYPYSVFGYVDKSNLETTQKEFIDYMNSKLVESGMEPLNGKKVMIMWLTYYNDHLIVFDDFIGVNFIIIYDWLDEEYNNKLEELKNDSN